MRNRVLILLASLLSSVVAATAQQTANKLKFIPVEIPGADATFVSGINNFGVMVGTYDVANKNHGFATNGRGYITIDVPKALSTSCFGINSNNAIVGSYQTRTTTHGFLYQNGKYTDIGPTDWGFAFGINDGGEIVGEYSPDGGTTMHGFLLNGTSYQTLDVPGSIGSLAFGINNQGSITLQWGDSNGVAHGALYDGSTFTTLDVPDALNSFPGAINNPGDIAFSWYYPQSSSAHGAVLHAGNYYKFMVPGSNRTAAVGINDFDVVVGEYWVHAQNVTPGYKLIP